MNHAFCILAHKPSVSLFYTVKYLSKHPTNRVFIHLDKKANIKDFCEINGGNVHFIEKRFNIEWGGANMVRATLALLDAVNVDGYCTLLSGDDFPCVSFNTLNAFFDSLGRTNLIHIQDFRNNKVDPYARFKYFYPKSFFKKERSYIDKVICMIYRVLPFHINKAGIEFLKRKNISLYKGTQWFSLSADALGKIKEFIRTEPDFISIFDGTFCPDETFFQTLAVHLKLPIFNDESTPNNCLRYIDWKSGPDFPKNLDLNDVESVKLSSCLFARKASAGLSEDDLRLFIRD